MEAIVLNIKNDQDISFNGQLAAQAYDSSKGIVITVYDTEKGHWLIALTDGKDVLIKHTVIEHKDDDKLVNALGFSPATKSIFEQLNIDTTKKLDV
ncbi:hypothetical protein [Pectobacterium jejuense]|uniref:hypothetical protein n=1 Tax=Pectobacterium jejuense TaxID=2974022 RepID=UPI002281092C|nr:hypothetical protein [Pectobacterium jejuense]MCY9846953.1 hypothetical protein [Pectobacterium jejuense]